MLMKDGKNDCDRCQDQPTASWFAKRELKRERERESERARERKEQCSAPKLCQLHNDYHIFHVWLRLQTFRAFS